MALSDATVSALVLKEKLISRKDLDAASVSARHLGASVIDVILGRGLVTEEKYGMALSKYFRVKYIDLSKSKIPQHVLSLIPEQFALSSQIIPFARKDNEVWVAMENPKDIELHDSIRKTLGVSYKVVPFVTTHAQLKEAFRQYKAIAQKETTDAKTSLSAQPATAITAIDEILDRAIGDEASDIHIEPLENEVLIRLRIDGVLHDQVAYPKTFHSGLITRIKILSDLKIDEVRLPQDGQFSFQPRSGHKVSLRVSTVPTVYGEKIVLRILHDSLTTFQLEELGMLPEDLERVERVLRRTHGMFLVTGPTGSGKTTTLYTVLGLLNKPESNIMTIEDPVENRLRRVNQIQVNPAIALTFAGGLRSMLRQDPDIIMVGEIRDNETAIIAVNAAMTGHLVFSSVHANTAAGAIPRLIDIGVEPFLIASTLHMVVAQRLVRKLCTHCVQPVALSAVTKKFLDDAKSHISTDILSRVKENFEAKGCSYCRKTGYRGRIGIFEILDMNEDIRSMVVAKATSDEIWKASRKNGAKTMLEDGLLKVIKGHTTLEEVFRVIST